MEFSEEDLQFLTNEDIQSIFEIYEPQNDNLQNSVQENYDLHSSVQENYDLHSSDQQNYDQQNQQRSLPNISFQEISRQSFKHPRFHRDVVKKKFIVSHNLIEFPDLFSVENDIDNAFSSMFSEELGNSADDDIISVSINHSELHSTVFINKKKMNFRKEDVLNSIAKVCQSGTSFLFNGQLDIEIAITKSVSGSGRMRKNAFITEEARRKRKKCIVDISNDDSSYRFRTFLSSEQE